MLEGDAVCPNVSTFPRPIIQYTPQRQQCKVCDKLAVSEQRDGSGLFMGHRNGKRTSGLVYCIPLTKTDH